MSTPQVAVLTSRYREVASTRAPARVERPLVTLSAFAALGGYGMLRWSTTLAHAPMWRLGGLLALSVAIAAAGMALVHSPRRWVLSIAVLVAFIAVFPLAGFPLRWATHMRIVVTGRAVGNGLEALPNVLVPYNGLDAETTAVIVLGAGMLLLLSGIALAAAPRPPSELRLGLVSVPLIVLAVVPSALGRPSVPYVHGAILFALLLALVLGHRVPRRQGYLATVMIAVSVLAAMVIAPRVDPRTPWIQFETIAGTLGSGKGETFNWAQRYGPLNWPRTGKEVLQIDAKFPDYWKTEDLDVFDGRGWVSSWAGSTEWLDGVSPKTIARFTQTLTVTLRGLSTHQVIAAGTAQEPTQIQGQIQPGAAPGTWVDSTELKTGESYRVTVYTPQPSAHELALAGIDYPGNLGPELVIELPPGSGGPSPLPSTSQAQIKFATFSSAHRVDGFAGLGARQAQSILSGSAYEPVFALARRLRADASTPYAYVQAVLRYLAHGYQYDETPPATRLPLLTFLLDNKLGYCQQFAGSMALLLRMGGIPARVATGFATGIRALTGVWDVADTNAHAWVEAWFPGYGWVRFDPTPPTAPALGGHAQATDSGGGNRPAKHTAHAPRREVGTGGAANARRRAGGSGSISLPLGIVLVLLVVLGGGLAAQALRWRSLGPSSDALLGELERAFAWCGRPLGDGVTLGDVEARVCSSTDAASYVRAISDSRYAAAAGRPTIAGRRALRSQLRAGLGPLGAARAWIALPPAIVPGANWLGRVRRRLHWS